MVMAIIGDIGGTNCRLILAVVDKNQKQPQILLQKKLLSKDFEKFEDVIKDFLSFNEWKKPDIGVFGVPGVKNKFGIINMANLKWTINLNTIEQTLKIPKVIILNDLVSQGYGLLSMAQENIITLNRGEPFLNEPMVLVVPGTGLGECILVPQQVVGQTSYNVWGSESGHSMYAPANNQQKKYQEFVMKLENLDEFWVEKSVSGTSLLNIFKFFKNDHNCSLSPSDIFQQAYNDKDTVCLQNSEKIQPLLFVQVVDFFFENLAYELANMSLRTLCRGGLYLSGNIINTSIQYLLEFKEEKFMKHFLNKRPVIREILEIIPIYLVKDDNDELGIKGAFEVVFRNIS